jgi:hypothetical protein
MVRPGRDRLDGVVEVDETFWGGEEIGVVGRQTEDKALIIIAAEEDGMGIGRIRIHTIPDASSISLHGFIREAIAPGSTVRCDGWRGNLGHDGNIHDRQVRSHQEEGEHLLARVHRVISLPKRWLLGTHQGAIGQEHLDDYLGVMGIITTSPLNRFAYFPRMPPVMSYSGRIVSLNFMDSVVFVGIWGWTPRDLCPSGCQRYFLRCLEQHTQRVIHRVRVWEGCCDIRIKRHHHHILRETFHIFAANGMGKIVFLAHILFLFNEIEIAAHTVSFPWAQLFGR